MSFLSLEGTVWQSPARGRPPPLSHSFSPPPGRVRWAGPPAGVTLGAGGAGRPMNWSAPRTPWKWIPLPAPIWECSGIELCKAAGTLGLNPTTKGTRIQKQCDTFYKNITQTRFWYKEMETWKESQVHRGRHWKIQPVIAGLFRTTRRPCSPSQTPMESTCSHTPRPRPASAGQPLQEVLLHTIWPSCLHHSHRRWELAAVLFGIYIQKVVSTQVMGLQMIYCYMGLCSSVQKYNLEAIEALLSGTELAQKLLIRDRGTMSYVLICVSPHLRDAEIKTERHEHLA